MKRNVTWSFILALSILALASLTSCSKSVFRCGLAAEPFAEAGTTEEDDSWLTFSEDELWIIVGGPVPPSAPGGEELPGSGELRAVDPDGEETVPLPLKHTDVHARIAGSIATVNVTQQYHNPFETEIEAEYVFPLPQNGAVSEFVMSIGDRSIRGIVREREEAEEIYRQAKLQGYTAALLTQERPNLFTQRVANIAPGREIDIRLTYHDLLPLRDGSYRFVFPTVVGPRFNPPGSTDGVGAVARDRRGSSGQPTELSYLRPGERGGHDLSLAVELDAGVPIEEIDSPTHAVDIGRPAPGRAAVRLAERAAIPNRDFVLRYRLAGEGVKPALFTHEDETGRYFTLQIHPPHDVPTGRRNPRELIFVIDCSGSMSGKPLAAATGAAARVLRRLDPDDSFQIIRFSSRASALGPEPLPATPENIRRGLDHLRSLGSGGGTMMVHGIRAALDFPHDDRRIRLVTFMTDGFIGNEAEILQEIARRLGPARIFGFGIGSAPNRYLLDRMAMLGRGAAAYVTGDGEDDDDAVDAFFRRISHAALSEIEIDWGGMEVAEVYPSRVPDLFPGRPVTLTGKFTGEIPEEIVLRARIEGDHTELRLPLDRSPQRENGALPLLWARRKIVELALLRTYAADPGPLESEIRSVALAHGLMSRYTSFIAVDSAQRHTPGGDPTVPVAVPVPEGTSYKNTVAEQ